MNKAIITAAITGSIHTPSMSEHLPITPDEIANEAIRSYEAGAAVVHIHVRDPENGSPSSDKKLYGEILSKIKEKTCLSSVCNGNFGWNPSCNGKSPVFENYC